MEEKNTMALTRKVLVEKYYHIFYDRAECTQYISRDIQVFTVPVVVDGTELLLEVGWDSEIRGRDKIFVGWFEKQTVNPAEQNVLNLLIENKKQIFSELQTLPF